MQYLLFVGPYFAYVTYAEFNEAQLTVRRRYSDGADWAESMKAKAIAAGNPANRKLYLLGTDAARVKLRTIIQETDSHFKFFMDQADNFECTLIFSSSRLLSFKVLSIC
jgi:hypothetical protein